MGHVSRILHLRRRVLCDVQLHNSTVKAMYSSPSLLTSKTSNWKEDALKIFHAGVQSVLPNQAINRLLEVKENILTVENKSYRLHKNVTLVGFGKAVAGMAKAVEEILTHHIVSGVISVPEGTLTSNFSRRYFLPNLNGNIKIIEGAKRNLPDLNAHRASQEIADLVSRGTPEDLLIVLISGGGSALLPLPVPPVTIEEKQTVTKLLSMKGATIQELNSVRKRLSLIKGGGLVQMSHASKILVLILSDVIGDDLQSIASSPTVANTDDPQLPLNIFKKYQLLDAIPESVLHVLQRNELKYKHHQFQNVHNVLVGSNQIALKAAARCAEEMDYECLVLTSSLQGEARMCGEGLATLAAILHQGMTRSKKSESLRQSDVAFICKHLGISTNQVDKAFSLANSAFKNGKGVCILCGGETTVNVIGDGTGGRNQELALSFGIKIGELLNCCAHLPILLSAGTDGFDGPNDAAGAFGFPALTRLAETDGMNPPASYLRNNDSYHFYQNLCNGAYHIITGHTGTNVMDIQVLLVKGDTFM